MSQNKRKIGRLIIWFAVLGIICLHAWSLMRYPAPFVDEAWFASRDWAFIHTGRNFGPLDAGILDRFSGYWTFLPLLPTLLQSSFLRFFEAPNLLAVRITSLISGLMLLAAIFYAGSAAGGRRLGLLSALLTSLSWPFLYSAHIARIDIFAATFGYGAIALYLNSRPAKPWINWISGLLVGLAFEIHPHSAIFFPAVIALFFHDHGWNMFKKHSFWEFIAGTVTGLVFYLAIHILQYPATYFALNKLVFAATHTPPVLTLNPGIIANASVDMVKMLIIIYRPLILILIIAVIWLAKRHTHQDLSLLWLGTALLLGVILLIRNKFFTYMILLTPALDMIAAAFLGHLAEKSAALSLRDYAIYGLVGGLCLGYFALNISVLSNDTGQSYLSVQNKINQAIPSGDSVMAAQLYWFGLYQHDYYSWEQLIYYQRLVPGSTLEEAFAEFKPDIFIIDGHVSQYISNQEGDSTYSQNLRLPKTEMDMFLYQHATLVSAFDSGQYGQIRIYKIIWMNK